MARKFDKGELRKLALLAGLLGICAAMAAPAPALAAVEWDTETVWAPSPPQEGESGAVVVYLYNRGSTASTVSLHQVTFQFPSGVTFDGTSAYAGPEWFCSGGGTTTATCFSGGPIGATGVQSLALGFDVATGISGELPYSLTLEGGGASSPHVETGSVKVGTERYGFGFTPGSLVAGTFDEAGADYSTAGGHPFAAIGAFDVNLSTTPTGPGQTDLLVAEGGVPKDIVTELPPGFVGNPTAVPRCSYEDFPNNCPPATQIGIVRTMWPAAGLASDVTAVYNMVPPGRLPAQFAFNILGFNIAANPEVQADGDYAIKLKASNLPEAIQPLRISLQVWGTPADPSHDAQRCDKPNIAAGMICNGFSQGGFPSSDPSVHPHPSTAPEKAFLTNPTNCADSVVTKFHMSLWTNPAPTEDFTDPRWHNFAAQSPDVTDCDDLPFAPVIDFEPTTGQADSPTGLNVHLHIPQDGLEDPDGLATAHLKKTTVTLPEGVAFNASAAGGLEACTPAQIGLVSAPGASPARFDNAEPSCPAASKIADARVKTPLLDNELAGELFLASQDRNPFDSTFAIYIVVREPSILVKLAGLVELDENTGRITTTFDDNPQLPFSDLELNFFNGPRASLATPSTCGTFATRNEFVPWSAQDPDNPARGEVVVNDDSFSITQGAGGQGCASSVAQLPLNVGLNAGTSDPIAGAHSPFSIQITRADGSQELDRLAISPPLGFVASLKGIPYCSEAQIAATATRSSGRAEQQSPTCPAASQVGTTSVGAGAGSDPFYAPGKVYLAGPYRGQKLSVVAVTPAVAGPFDLGNVVVRSVLAVDPKTAQITAITDPLPRAIEGVPLRIRDIRIQLDRPGWTQNPTSCEPKSVEVTAFGTGGAVSRPSNRFQLTGCSNLGFKPKLTLKLAGGTRRGAHPALRATLKPRAGDANFARAAVTLPHSAFLDQAHIRTICTRVQFAADACPPGAIYGYAAAYTPLFDNPIQGPVYLRSSDNKLPDLVADLAGQVDVELVGRIDSVKGGIRNTFDVIPDAPVTKFVLTMQGGKKGLVVNSENLCASTNRARVKLTAQNGRRYDFAPKVVPLGCKKARSGHHGRA